MNDVVFRLAGITRTFEQAGSRLDVLRGIDLDLKRGETVALVGPSGTGKSTLLHIIGLLEPPTAGSIIVGDTDAATASDGKRTELRRQEIGFVYQFHHLLPEFSALENIGLPQMIAGVSAKSQQCGRDSFCSRWVCPRARITAPRVCQAASNSASPSLVRWLIIQKFCWLMSRPVILTSATAEDVFSLLKELVRSTGLAALIATHNLNLARRMDRIVELHEGRLRNS